MNKKQILIVDGDEFSQLMLFCCLEHLAPASNVIAAEDGLSALAYLQEQPFDLIIADDESFKINGLELAQVVRQMSPQTQVVLMSRFTQTGLYQSTLANYLAKPFTMRQLRQFLQPKLQEPLQQAVIGVTQFKVV
jgi:CheY-like chemotaxis protein